MSKQRPSTMPRSSPPRGRSASPRVAPRAWSRRLFKNSYTRRGRRIRLRAWSIKIQHRGRRHTFSLGAVPRAVAADRAHALYRTIVTRGWDAAWGAGGDPPLPRGPAPPRRPKDAALVLAPGVAPPPVHGRPAGPLFG